MAALSPYRAAEPLNSRGLDSSSIGIPARAAPAANRRPRCATAFAAAVAAGGATVDAAASATCRCVARPPQHLHRSSPRAQRHRCGVRGPGGADGMSALLQGMIGDLRADPALAALLDDPRVAAAVQEVAKDPGALQRYATDRKVSAAGCGVLGVVVGRGAAQCADYRRVHRRAPITLPLRCLWCHPPPKQSRSSPTQVMAVLGRLVERDMPTPQAAAFSSMVSVLLSSPGLRRGLIVAGLPSQTLPLLPSQPHQPNPPPTARAQHRAVRCSQWRLILNWWRCWPNPK